MYQFLSYIFFYCSNANTNTPQDHTDDSKDSQDSEDEEGVIDGDGSSSSTKGGSSAGDAKIVVMKMTKMMITSLLHWLKVLLPIIQDVGDQAVRELVSVNLPELVE